MSAYPESELKESLERAFHDVRPPKEFDNGPQYSSVYIRFDGYEARNPFLSAAWNLAIAKGWIRVETIELEQETFMKGYLTELGAKELT